MKPKLIKTEADYDAVMARIDALFAGKPGTPEGDELDLLVTLVELYENKAFPIDLPDPITAIQFRMEQQGLKANQGLAPKEYLRLSRALNQFVDAITNNNKQ